MMPLTSDNTVSTLRRCRSLVRTEVGRRKFEEVDTVAEKIIQPDNLAPPNRIAATPNGRLRQ
ncbi:hypothetical protein M6D81_31050 [Paenibacillus sp. J5C_2022]|nr:hypothetical protein [Paenibacillus sp. J5C2022]